jgi:hypothetical protein
MITILLEIDHALANFHARHQARPVAVHLGERKFTQLILDVAQLGPPAGLSTDAGRPRSYRNLELLHDESERGYATNYLTPPLPSSRLARRLAFQQHNGLGFKNSAAKLLVAQPGS